MDTESLLRSFSQHSVRHVVIGATAFPVHRYARATLAIDIFFESSEETACRTHAALASFRYDLSDVSVEDLKTKKDLIRQSLVEADVHPFVAG